MRQPREAQPRSAAAEARLEEAALKYRRGEKVDTAAVKDKKLRGVLQANEEVVTTAGRSAAQAESWLLPAQPGFLEAEGMERTYRFSQEALVEAADVTAARKAFDLSLALGPYSVDYTPNGRHLLLGGRRGHLALVDWTRPRLVTEVQARRARRSPGRRPSPPPPRPGRPLAPSSFCTTATSSPPRRRSTCTSTTSGGWRCTACATTRPPSPSSSSPASSCSPAWARLAKLDTWTAARARAWPLTARGWGAARCCAATRPVACCSAATATAP